MIRRIEIIKFKEVYGDKRRAEYAPTYADGMKELIANSEGIADFKVEVRCDTNDPLEGDLFIQIDFENKDAFFEYELDMDHLALSFEMGEYIDSMLSYDLDI